MALIEYVSLETADDRTRALLEEDAEQYGRPSLFARILAHSPETLTARQEYTARLRAESSLDDRLVELVYVAVSASNDCDYCVASHTEQLVEHVGLSPDTVTAVIEGEATLDSREAAAVAVARTVAAEPKRVDESDLDSLRSAGFDDREVIELIVTASAAVAANTITDALNVLPADGALSNDPS